MKKLISVSIPVVTIGIFIFIMNSSFLFKEPNGYNVPSHLEMMEQSILIDDWAAVDAELSAMKQIMEKKIFPFIQFSVEKDEMIQIDMNLYRVEGCVRTKNKELAVSYLQEINSHWENLNK